MVGERLTVDQWRTRRLTAWTATSPVGLITPPPKDFRPAVGTALFWASIARVYVARERHIRAQADRMHMFLEHVPDVLGSEHNLREKIQALEHELSEAHCQVSFYNQGVSEAYDLQRSIARPPSDSAMVSASADDH